MAIVKLIILQASSLIENNEQFTNMQKYVIKHMFRNSL